MAKKDARFGLITLAVKIGSKFGAASVKLLKVLKVGKVALAGASAAAYTVIFTWQFALVILAMLFLHEGGHLLMMKRYRIPTKGMYFIPFLGAAAVAEGEFPTRRSEAAVAIAGPIVGTVLAVGCGVAYWLTGNAYCAAIAGWSAFINLFNLLPVSPLDGGRVLKSVTFSIGSKIGLYSMVITLVLVGIWAVKSNLIIFVILLPVGVLEFLFERRMARRRQDQPKPVMSPRASLVAFVGYVGLALFLWVFMVIMSHEPGAAAAMHALQG